jgi:hypothetical protein
LGLHKALDKNPRVCYGRINPRGRCEGRSVSTQLSISARSAGSEAGPVDALSVSRRQRTATPAIINRPVKGEASEPNEVKSLEIRGISSKSPEANPTRLSTCIFSDLGAKKARFSDLSIFHRSVLLRIHRIGAGRESRAETLDTKNVAISKLESLLTSATCTTMASPPLSPLSREVPNWGAGKSQHGDHKVHRGSVVSVTSVLEASRFPGRLNAVEARATMEISIATGIFEIADE